jgi:hypothetical protein
MQKYKARLQRCAFFSTPNLRYSLQLGTPLKKQEVLVEKYEDWYAYYYK